MDEVALTVVEEVFHVHSLPKLRADYQDVVLMSILGSQELAVTVLNCFVVVLECGVIVLVQHSDNLKRVLFLNVRFS